MSAEFANKLMALNESRTRLTEAIVKFEKQLANIRVEAILPIDSTDDLKSLIYSKDVGKWRLCVEFKDGEVKPLADCSGYEKLEAFPFLNDLLIVIETNMINFKERIDKVCPPNLE